MDTESRIAVRLSALPVVADAGEVTDGEQGKDAEGEPGVGVRREEVEERADEADHNQSDQGGHADALDTAVVDLEEVGDATQDGHAEAGSERGLKHDTGADWRACSCG